MLTADLILVRTYRGEIRPRYIQETETSALDLAKALVEIFAGHVGKRREELDRELKDFLGTGTDFLLHRALAKLLFDRSEFDTSSPVAPEELRRATFEAAAAAYQKPHDSDDVQAFHFDHAAVLAAAAASFEELSTSDVETSLYADLKDQQIFLKWKPCTPEWLVKRYNVALAQGALLRATELRIRIAGQTTNAYRELFRKIKFFQLLHRVKRLDEGDGWEIVLDGPLSLFQASGRYGLQMASFLPTLLHFDGWELAADLRWGKKRAKRTFRLSPETGLQTTTRLLGQWQPEEQRWFPEQFEKLESDWEISAEGELVNLGGEGVMVPDFVFHHPPSGTRASMEVFGFWRKGAVASRLKLLRRHGPKNLILALSKQLAGGQEGLDEIPGEVYVFRTTPLARQVLKILEGLRPAEKGKKTKTKKTKTKKTKGGR
jgi:predicted nuclease of restriction endonuclease-like RecB superfamily